jgi:tRNA A37 threonylcarbamoyladenosine synthetase subunit TsaC/SUA5/YrdC
MRTVALEDGADRVAEALIDALATGVAVLPMSRVYVIVAAPTSEGARALDRTKRRRANQYYSTSQAAPDALARLVLPGALDPALHAALPHLEGALFRVPVAAPEVETPAIHRGYHQALVLPMPLRPIFARVEHALRDVVEPGLFGHRPTSAVLSTSCNLSGDPRGTIVDRATARAFAADQGAALFVDGPIETGPGFPIVELAGRGWRLRRDGDLSALLASLPAGAIRLPDA